MSLESKGMGSASTPVLRLVHSSKMRNTEKTIDLSLSSQKPTLTTDTINIRKSTRQERTSQIQKLNELISSNHINSSQDAPALRDIEEALVLASRINQSVLGTSKMTRSNPLDFHNLDPERVMELLA